MLLLDGDGGFIEPGRFSKTVVSDFLNPDLVSTPKVPDVGWVLGSASTNAGSTMAVSTLNGGGVALTTAATADRSATIVRPALDMTKMSGFRMTVAMTGGSDSTATMMFGVRPSGSFSSGAMIVASPGGTTKIRAYSSGPTTTDIDTGYEEWAGTNRLEVFSMIITRSLWVYWGKDGNWDDVGYDFGSLMALGSAVVPTIRIENGAASAVARTRHIHQVKIQEWYP